MNSAVIEPSGLSLRYVILGILSAIVQAAIGMAAPMIEAVVAPLTGGGVCMSLKGRSGDRTYFFKSAGGVKKIMRYGNLEAEVIVAELFLHLGVPAPESRVVELRGQPGSWLQQPWLDAATFGGAEPNTLGSWLAGTKKLVVSERDVALLQIVDILVGNGDRHEKNILVVEDVPGRRVPLLVPIDHNLALTTPNVVSAYTFLHFSPTFDGIPVQPFDRRTRSFANPALAKFCGHPMTLVRKNLLYRSAWIRVERSPAVRRRYCELAVQVARRLSNTVLDELVATVPLEDIGGDDPVTRRLEIRKGLETRRDLLARFFEETQWLARDDYRAGWAWFVDRVGEDLASRIAPTAPARVAVGSRMRRYAEWEYDAEDAYVQLRELDVDPVRALEVLESCAPGSGVALTEHFRMDTERDMAILRRVELVDAGR